MQGYRSNIEVIRLCKRGDQSDRSSHYSYPHPTSDYGNVRELMKGVTWKRCLRDRETEATPGRVIRTRAFEALT